MTTRKPREVLSGLMDWSEDGSQDEAGLDEELTAAGVDVPAFLAKVRARMATVAEASRLSWRDEAQRKIVWSESGAVKWAISGKDAPGIRFGARLSSYSHAHDYFRGKTLPTGPQEVPGHAWVERDLDDDIWEDSVPIPTLRSVLSLLWFRGFSND